MVPQNTPASATPACDGRHLVVYFSTIGLLGLDAADGRGGGAVPSAARAGLPHGLGAANSPIITNDLAIFCQDDDLLPYVVAVDVATGRDAGHAAR